MRRDPGLLRVGVDEVLAQDPAQDRLLAQVDRPRFLARGDLEEGTVEEVGRQRRRRLGNPVRRDSLGRDRQAVLTPGGRLKQAQGATARRSEQAPDRPGNGL
jgi:hypothetical protein